MAHSKFSLGGYSKVRFNRQPFIGYEYVYFLMSPNEQWVKVGKANNVRRRMGELTDWAWPDSGRATLVALRACEAGSAFPLEAEYHHRLRQWRVSDEREMFRLAPEVYDLINEVRLIDINDVPYAIPVTHPKRRFVREGNVWPDAVSG